jgi:hypothetical protein
MSGSNVAPAPTANAQISAGQATVANIGFGYYPGEGSRCVVAQYNWTANLFYNEDLSQLVARGVETTIQSVFCDNSTNPEPVTMSINGTNQVIVIPANSQGIFPLFFSGQPGFSISVPSEVFGAVTRLYLLNVPANSSGTWATLGTPAVNGNVSALGITGNQAVKATPGKVFKVIVNATTATGTITINDAPAPGTVTVGNTILTIPIGTLAGTVYDLTAPALLGISVNFNGGATGTIAVIYA